MTLRLNGATSGFTEIDAPAVAGNNTLLLPGGAGAVDQALVTNGSGTLSFADRGRMVLGTSQASTSGTSVDFTGIPSWVKRVTVMFSGVSTSGTSLPQVQIGTSGGIQATGYAGISNQTFSGTTIVASMSSGFLLQGSTAATNRMHGRAFLSLLDAGTGLWVFDSCAGIVDGAVDSSGGSKSLSGTLDRVRITTVNGTDTFDAGSINILYEG